MLDVLRTRMLHLLRVPAAPVPPPGDPRMLRTFRAAPGYYRYKVATWMLKQLSAAVGLLFSYLFAQSVLRQVPFAFLPQLEQFFIAVFVAQLPLSLLLLRLNFELRWYMLSDRSMRVRHGIVSVHEQTMTFANVQNITIRQNPLQRLLGISTVAVRAAGGGSAQPGSGARKSSSHEVTFDGVDDADAIRDLIRERIRHYRDAGLGDLHEEAAAGQVVGAAPDVRAKTSPSGASTAGASEAARRLLSEVRSLRAVWPAPGRPAA